MTGPAENAVITWVDEPAETLPGPLVGRRLLVKDLIDTAGIRTTYGSKIYGEHVPERTASSVERLVAAGAVVIGKANLPEFAWSVIGQNPWYGTVSNPAHPGRTTGGSSSGNAAALAAGLCDLGARQRHGRLDPPALSLLRRRRPQAAMGRNRRSTASSRSARRSTRWGRWRARCPRSQTRGRAHGQAGAGAAPRRPDRRPAAPSAERGRATSRSRRISPRPGSPTSNGWARPSSRRRFPSPPRARGRCSSTRRSPRTPRHSPRVVTTMAPSYERSSRARVACTRPTSSARTRPCAPGGPTSPPSTSTSYPASRSSSAGGRRRARDPLRALGVRPLGEPDRLGGARDREPPARGAARRDGALSGPRLGTRLAHGG